MVRIHVDDSVTAEDAATVWSVYRSVFDDHTHEQTWRESVWDRHTTREGFRLARAMAEDSDGGGPVGFAYGYTGRPGQWWTDRAREVLDPEVAEAWLGGHFELVSIGVLDPARRAGTGRRLLHALLEGLPHDRLLLMTSSDPSTPARRLYAAEGWQVLGPGTADGTVVMGRRQ